MNVVEHKRSDITSANGACCVLVVAMTLLSVSGCEDQSDTVRQIQAKRQLALQASARQDHLGETHALLKQFIELNEEKAQRQIAYHLNQWRGQQSDQSADGEVPEIVQTLNDFGNVEMFAEAIARPEFQVEDVPWIRDAFLFNRVVQWVDVPSRSTPLYDTWIDSLAKGDGLTEPQADQLRSSIVLFDWTVRNVALEAKQLQVPPQLPLPPMPLGLKIEGPGYRQTDYETLWRGRGDSYQRAGVFTELLLQAGIPSAVLATQGDTGELTPWCVGVLIGKEIYLFDPELGLPIPGPDQTGVATLAEARKDPSVMRRLGVAGYFDAPQSRSNIQQSVALLNVRPEVLSSRMEKLESALTGDRRMTLWVDSGNWMTQFDSVSGIAGARLWTTPLLAEVYSSILKAFAERDPAFAFWYISRWAILESEDANAKNLALGRWRHLGGEFADDDQAGKKGARSYFLEQRAPEFEIDDLRINVDLQKNYGIRRGLGVDKQNYDRQLQQVQMFMRMGKRTATYWLALVQYDDDRFETASNWFTKRVLDDSQRSTWNDSAIYNSARAYERLGNVDDAIETLKTDKTSSDHGNRLRARLLDKHRDLLTAQ